MHICIWKITYFPKYNVFNVFLVCMPAALIVWYWTTNSCALLWELPVLVCIGSKPSVFPLSNVTYLLVSSLLNFMLMEPCCWASDSVDYKNLTKNSLIPWLLKSFLLCFCNVLLTLSTGLFYLLVLSPTTLHLDMMSSLYGICLL